MKLIFTLSVLVGLLFSQPALAEDAASLERDIRDRWQHAFWQMTDKGDKIDALQALEAEAENFQNLYPKRVEATIWYGIILASEASLIRNASVIKKSERARDIFLKAIDMDPGAMKGAAHRMLGTLYHQVPGWPFSYGNDKKAEHYFIEALKIDADGMDANFLYANFLTDKKRYNEALKYLECAENAPLDIDYPLVNAKRIEEMADLRKTVLNKLQR